MGRRIFTKLPAMTLATIPEMNKEPDGPLEPHYFPWQLEQAIAAFVGIMRHWGI
jgi:hypothetical protein